MNFSLMVVVAAVLAAGCATAPRAELTPDASRSGPVLGSSPERWPLQFVIAKPSLAAGGFAVAAVGADAGVYWAGDGSVPLSAFAPCDAGEAIVTLGGRAQCALPGAGVDGSLLVPATTVVYAGHVRTEDTTCSSVGSASCTMTLAIPTGTSGALDVIIRAQTGDGGLAHGRAQWTCSITNIAGTCGTWGLGCRASLPWESSDGGAGSWVPSVSLVGCNLTVGGTGVTGAGTVDWAATIQYAGVR